MGSAISFQFVSPVTLDTPGLLTTFGFDYYSAPSGVIRFTAVGTGLDTRTFEFDSFINNGVYETLSGGVSPNSDAVTATGSRNTSLPEPMPAALTGLGLLLLAACRSMHRVSGNKQI